MLCCRLLMLCILYRIVSNSSCIKLTNFKVEEITFVGGRTTLECNYDLEGEKLYSLKWYKDGNEFYRFLPLESPQVQVFKVMGVYVDKMQSTARSVHLRGLELASSGRYRCEVSADAPSFQTVTNRSVMLTTVALRDEGPHISKVDSVYTSSNSSLNVQSLDITVYVLYIMSFIMVIIRARIFML